MLVCTFHLNFRKWVPLTELKHPNPTLLKPTAAYLIIMHVSIVNRANYNKTNHFSHPIGATLKEEEEEEEQNVPFFEDHVA